MPCPVSLVPFHLVIGNGNFRSVRDLSRDGNVVAALDLEEVGFVGVGLANTRPWDCQVASSLETIFAREGASFPTGHYLVQRVGNSMRNKDQSRGGDDAN